MRRYAFESILSHALWFLVIFSFTNGFAIPFADWMQSFYQWDARWYGTMAQDGHGFLPQTYVFPPVHGWVLGRLTDLTVWIAGFFTTTPSWVSLFYFVVLANGLVMFALANTIFVWISARRWNADRRTLWIVALSNPMGYFALTAYSDMLYFALFHATMTLAIWTGARRTSWRLPELGRRQNISARLAVTTLLFVAPWVRLTGFSFSALALLKRKEAAAVLVSLAAFLTYYWVRTDNPLFFLLAQEVFAMPKGHFFDGLILSTNIIRLTLIGDIPQGGDAYLYALNFGFLPMICLMTTLVFSGWLYRRREFEWASVILAMAAISHNQAFWRSTVRYTLPLFPLFFWMLLIKDKPSTPRRRLIQRVVIGLAVGTCLSLQIFYGRLFQAGGWAF